MCISEATDDFTWWFPSTYYAELQDVMGAQNTSSVTGNVNYNTYKKRCLSTYTYSDVCQMLNRENTFTLFNGTFP